MLPRLGGTGREQEILGREKLSFYDLQAVMSPAENQMEPGAATHISLLGSPGLLGRGSTWVPLTKCCLTMSQDNE